MQRADVTVRPGSEHPVEELRAILMDDLPGPIRQTVALAPGRDPAPASGHTVWRGNENLPEGRPDQGSAPTR